MKIAGYENESKEGDKWKNRLKHDSPKLVLSHIPELMEVEREGGQREKKYS